MPRNVVRLPHLGLRRLSQHEKRPWAPAKAFDMTKAPVELDKSRFDRPEPSERMRLPNLYLKWHGFRELTNCVDTDKDVGIHLFRHEDGAEPFSKLLRGDLSCASDIADALTRYMSEWISTIASRMGGPAVTRALMPADLELPTLAFMARLAEALPNLPEERLDRAHKVLVRDLTVTVPAGQPYRLAVERYVIERSFDGLLPSGGQGPVVFVAGRDKGQIAALGVPREPIAAYTLFTRDPAPAGQRLWEMAWGETVLWLPSPSQPSLQQGRLLLMPRAEAVMPTPGHFHVTTALVWKEEALKALEPRPAGTPSGSLDERETMLFLTRLRRMADDRRRRWDGAVSILTASYIVETSPR